MGERELVRPLAPAADRQSSDEEGASRHHKKRSRKCCVFIAAIFVILVVAFVVMRFTAFRVKEPIIKMNGVVTQIELTSGTIPKPGLKMSLIAEYVSMVGEARNGPDHVRARWTMRKVTVDIIPDRII
ncbi:hypothetical protein Peur_022392 [Populus x canadensis]